MGINGTSTKTKSGHHPLFGLGKADAKLKDGGCYAVDIIIITLVAIAMLVEVAMALTKWPCEKITTGQHLSLYGQSSGEMSSEIKTH